MCSLFCVLGVLMTAGFNILKEAVVSFDNDDPLFGREIVQSKDGYVATISITKLLD